MVVLISVVVYLSQMNNDTVKHISILDEANSLKESIRDKAVKYSFLEDLDLEAAKYQKKRGLWIITYSTIDNY